MASQPAHDSTQQAAEQRLVLSGIQANRIGAEQPPMSAAVCRLAKCGCILLWFQQLALHPKCQGPPTLRTGNALLLKLEHALQACSAR